MEISDKLLCLFSTRLEQRDGDYVIEVPRREIEQGDVEGGEIYRVAVLPQAGTEPRTPDRGDRRDRGEHREPPVDEGEVREVEIETLGDQGDGIARVERGYVVIVPDTEPGDVVEVEIEDVRENFALGTVVEDESLEW